MRTVIGTYLATSSRHPLFTRRLPTLEAAKRFVARQPKEENWRIYRVASDGIAYIVTEES